MATTISQPPADAHVAACGLFCTNCGKFKKGRCQGCQIEAGYAQCAVRKCVIEKKIETCAACPEFAAPRDYRECAKVHNFISKVFALFMGSDRPGALAMLRDRGLGAFVAATRESGKM
jgi:hypothetical protein